MCKHGTGYVVVYNYAFAVDLNRPSSPIEKIKLHDERKQMLNYVIPVTLFDVQASLTLIFLPAINLSALSLGR